MESSETNDAIQCLIKSTFNNIYAFIDYETFNKITPCFLRCMFCLQKYENFVRLYIHREDVSKYINEKLKSKTSTLFVEGANEALQQYFMANSSSINHASVDLFEKGFYDRIWSQNDYYKCLKESVKALEWMSVFLNKINQTEDTNIDEFQKMLSNPKKVKLPNFFRILTYTSAHLKVMYSYTYDYACLFAKDVALMLEIPGDALKDALKHKEKLHTDNLELQREIAERTNNEININNRSDEMHKLQNKEIVTLKGIIENLEQRNFGLEQSNNAFRRNETVSNAEVELLHQRLHEKDRRTTIFSVYELEVSSLFLQNELLYSGLKSLRCLSYKIKDMSSILFKLKKRLNSLKIQTKQLTDSLIDLASSYENHQKVSLPTLNKNLGKEPLSNYRYTKLLNLIK